MAKRASSKSPEPAGWGKLSRPEWVSAKWRKLLALIPGYDCFRDAAGCRFDAEAAQRAIDFFPECLRHIEGEKAGQPFELEPWQQAVLACLFGWYQLDAHGRVVRRYREVLIYIPRKCGKTPLVAGISLYVFFCDEEAGQQDYIAAAERNQAGMLFRHAKGMVEQEAALKDRCRIYGGTAQAGQSKSIVLLSDPGSFLQIISADANTKHGGNSHLVAVDELHAQPNRELIDVLRSSMASDNRKQPLLIYITTADFNRPSICNEIHDYACQVRDGKVKDARFLPVIYEALAKDDWTSPKTWAKANPNLGVSVSLDYLTRECQKALENPALENTFRRLHLNQRTEQDVRAIPMDKWDAVASGLQPIAWRREALERLKGKECKGGLDLGSTSDLTALVLLFGPPYELLPFFWIPGESARQRERRDRVPYTTWIQQGFISETEGDTTDYDQIRTGVGEIADTYGVKELAVDRLFQGAQLCTQLLADGLNVIAFGQGFLSMAAPTKRFLELVLAQELQHGGNPVLRWMAANLATEIDAAGNQKPSKKKSTEKIDGIVGAIMAVGRMMLEAQGGSVYDDPETPVF